MSYIISGYPAVEYCRMSPMLQQMAFSSRMDEMCTRLSLGIVVGLLGLTSCGSSLVLPDDGSPAELKAVSGDGQEGTIGSRLDLPLVVRVTDARGLPLAGVRVTFRFQAEDPVAQVDPEATTDGDGRASAQVRLGVDVGVHVVEAQVAEASAEELRATFDLTAVDREKDKKGHGHGDDDGEEHD